MVKTDIPRAEEREYLALQRFAEENDKITYFQFDSYTTQKINLFALPEHERFLGIEKFADSVIARLPTFKRILSKPITRLKDVTNVLPIEAVRVINNATMGHIALHTELWGNVTKDGLKPKKLMTLSHEEDYKIYENVAFARLIDGILAFVRKNVRLLRDIMYSCKPLNFNLLERTNHLMHFLAIGKLHVGYAHAQDTYHLTHQRCLEKLLFIEKSLAPKLNAPVYRICRKDHSKLTLKKTNVFRLQKDYMQVYALLKKFADKDEQVRTDMNVERVPERAYANYCAMLAVFSAGHFNFVFDERQELSFNKLDATCKFSKWTLNIESLELDGVYGLRLKVRRNKVYKICFIFDGEQNSTKKVRAFKREFSADEYLFAQPYGAKAKENVLLSLFDISSFRRIQQCILRAMVYSDTKRDTCPFCGMPLEKVDGGHECSLCRTFITEQTCPETGKTFFATQLKGYKIPRKSLDDTSTLFNEKEKEGLLFYRNITPISAMGKPICPHCGKQHKFI